MHSDPKLPSETERRLDDVHGRLVTCGLNELRPHPSYVRLHLTVPASKLSALAEMGDLAFRERLVITGDRLIIDGYARWELARLQGREMLQCIEYERTESEALQWLLQMHRRSNGLNAFNRILLALELEPWFREKARSNQRSGGQAKGSSNLTEVDRVDVRSEIASIAGVSVGKTARSIQVLSERKGHQENHTDSRGEASIENLASRNRSQRADQANCPRSIPAHSIRSEWSS